MILSPIPFRLAGIHCIFKQNKYIFSYEFIGPIFEEKNLLGSILSLSCNKNLNMIQISTFEVKFDLYYGRIIY